jgi:hypothetical protein
MHTYVLTSLYPISVACETLNTELLEHESYLIEFAQESISALDVRIETIGNEFRTIATEHFRAIEQLENNFFDAVTHVQLTHIKKYVNMSM